MRPPTPRWLRPSPILGRADGVTVRCQRRCVRAATGGPLDASGDLRLWSRAVTCYRTASARGRIGDMQVTLWYFAGCPNWRIAGQRLRQALDEVGRTAAQ